MKFYSNVVQYRNEILLSEYQDGKKKLIKHQLMPYLFIESIDQEQPLRDLKNNPVELREFRNTFEARKFIDDNKNVHKLYGMDNHLYPWINNNYEQNFDYDFSQLSIGNIDIEVYTESGFPHADQAEHPITTITIEHRNKVFVLGPIDYVVKSDDVHYVKYKDEKDLLLKFLNLWQALDLDIITGWNIEPFDVPYIINRVIRVLGPQYAKKLSPWGIITQREVIDRFGSRLVYDIAGISTIDYLALYRKFSFKNQESYSLNYIAYVEVGEKKLDYEGYKNLSDLWIRNPDLYIDYNIKDVRLVTKIDNKLRMIEQLVAVAYDAKVNFQDAFTSVKMWDVIIHNYLFSKNIVVPIFKLEELDPGIEGAYVKNPVPGFYEWVVSFDLNSLYPMLIQQYNISPECLVGLKAPGITVDQILNGYVDSIRGEMVEQNITMAATGYSFSRDKQGFLAALMEKMYADRESFKNQMLDYKKQLQQVNDEIKRRGIENTK